MTNAELIRQITNNSRNDNQLLSKAYNNAIAFITEQAQDGKNEICYYDVEYKAMREHYNSKVIERYSTQDREMRNQLKDKLQSDGFSITKGMYLGKGMGSWETPYIVW